MTYRPTEIEKALASRSIVAPDQPESPPERTLTPEQDWAYDKFPEINNLLLVVGQLEEALITLAEDAYKHGHSMTLAVLPGDEDPPNPYITETQDIWQALKWLKEDLEEAWEEV